MKKITLLISIIFLTSCGALVKIEKPEKPKDFQKTVILKTKHNSNYIKANEWMVTTFNNPKSIIQFSDKQAGIVKGKYIMFSGQEATQYTTAVKSYYAIITIRVKDNASKIEISPVDEFVIMNYMGSKIGFTPEMFIASAKVLANNFEKHMKVDSANDNW